MPSRSRPSPSLPRLLCRALPFALLLAAGGPRAPLDAADAPALGALPVRFEENLGQAPASIDFVARMPGYTLALGPGEIVLTLADGTEAAIEILDADPRSTGVGLEPRTGRVSYLRGRDPERWISDLDTFAKVRYEDLYPGIDLVAYGSEGQLEYDFVLSPGTSPDTIRLGLRGIERARIDSQGDLVLEAAGREIRKRRPIAYQEDACGARVAIDARFELISAEPPSIGFHVASYDPTIPLVIDPILVYSTYVGGISQDAAHAIATDPSGSIYLAGVTSSWNFPATAGSADPGCGIDGDCDVGEGRGPRADAFVMKLDPSGRELIYATYLGGSANDQANAITVDGEGSVYIGGTTWSSDFPLVNAAQASLGGGVCESEPEADAFIAKIDPTGSTLIYSTYVGGCSEEEVAGIVVDAQGRASIAGTTESEDFPVTEFSYDRSYAGSGDAFVARLSPDGGRIVYASFIGGIDRESGRALGVDREGKLYVAGDTAVSIFGNRFPETATIGPGGFVDAWVVKLDPQKIGSASLVFSTRIGGTSAERIESVAVDLEGKIYVAGSTGSRDFPVTPEAFQESCVCTNQGRDNPDVFVAKLDASGDRLIYASYLGGSEPDRPTTIAIDDMGRAYVAGTTVSTDFPIVRAFQSELAGDVDAFIAKISATGRSVAYASYLGGSLGGYFIAGPQDHPKGLALSPDREAIVAGYTYSVDFPITPDAIRSDPDDLPYFPAGIHEGFLARVGEEPLDLLASLGDEIEAEPRLTAPERATLLSLVSSATNAAARGDHASARDVLDSILREADNLRTAGRVAAYVAVAWMAQSLEAKERLLDPVDLAPRFVRGDCNGNGGLDGVPDAIFTLSYSFLGGAEPGCLAACDVNVDGTAADVTDVIGILSFSFLGGPPPAAPFPDCGRSESSSDEELGCEHEPESCD